jgi:hypothetical protein
VTLFFLWWCLSWMPSLDIDRSFLKGRVVGKHYFLLEMK